MIDFDHEFGKFSHSCCVDSQTSVTRQASRQRKESLLTEIDVNVCEVQPPPAVLMTVMDGVRVDEWPCMKLAWVFKYILVHVYIGMPIKLFFCTKVRGRGGGSKQILREYGFKKTSKTTDGP